MTKTNKKEVKVKVINNLKYDVEVLNNLPSKSAKVRYLDSMNVSRSEISKLLDIRYQHVRNVLVTLLKKDM